MDAHQLENLPPDVKVSHLSLAVFLLTLLSKMWTEYYLFLLIFWPLALRLYTFIAVLNPFIFSVIEVFVISLNPIGHTSYQSCPCHTYSSLLVESPLAALHLLIVFKEYLVNNFLIF